MHEKKQAATIKTLDLSKMQAVVIDIRTVIYIALGADPEEARKRYISRIGVKKP